MKRRDVAGTAVLALFVLGLYGTASAGDKPAAKPSSSSSSSSAPAASGFDPANRAHISQFMEVVVGGNGKFVTRDFPGAIEAYKKAIALAPNNPLGHYLLAEAQIASGNLTEAEAELTQADNVADKTPQVKAKVLFCIADLKERQKKWDDAKTAWQKYADWSQAHGDSGAMPQTAAARISAIDEAIKQDKAYDIVRQRIATEKDASTGG
ncbi:hypothetical protein BH09MYX1_BH09MYX1_17570 [soil metagenome]